MKRRVFALLLMLILCCTLLTACVSTTCDSCDKSFMGKGYYGAWGDEHLCEDCAKRYWLPLDYKEYAW